MTASQVTAYDNDGHSEMYTTARDDRVDLRLLPAGRRSLRRRRLRQSERALPDRRRPCLLLDHGRGLVPADTNEVEDVYEFAEGKPQLISIGHRAVVRTASPDSRADQHGPGLVSVSANGTDVYFATYETLVTQDHNGQEIKIYDARSNGGFPAERPKSSAKPPTSATAPAARRRCCPRTAPACRWKATRSRAARRSKKSTAEAEEAQEDTRQEGRRSQGGGHAG